jgi:splicing factor 3B subunit 5
LPQAADRFNVNTSLSKNWEHLQNKYVGTGHPDISKHEWAVNQVSVNPVGEGTPRDLNSPHPPPPQHRDTAASLLGHPDMLQYIAAAENVAVGRAKFTILESMLAPCGTAPAAGASKAAAGTQ